jgi:hypothetical protein
MRNESLKAGAVGIAAALICLSVVARTSAEITMKPGWDGKRYISYQQQKDLFYNYYAQPGPFNGAAAQLYISPRPVPPNVGHTWYTYQPFYPHEYLYKHQRSYYTHNPGAGWRRTTVRYGTSGLWCHNWQAEKVFPMSNNIWALHNDFFYPGLRW